MVGSSLALFLARGESADIGSMMLYDLVAFCIHTLWRRLSLREVADVVLVVESSTLDHAMWSTECNEFDFARPRGMHDIIYDIIWSIIVYLWLSDDI